MKKGRMAEIVKELQGASKMHLKQSKEIAEHIDDMDGSDKSSPNKMNSPLDISCWPGYKKVGTQESPSGKKTAGGNLKIVNDCKKI